MTTSDMQQASAVLVLLVCLVVGVVVTNVVIAVLWLARRDAVAAGVARPLFRSSWSLAHVWFGAQAMLAAILALAMLAVALLTLAPEFSLSQGLEGLDGPSVPPDAVWLLAVATLGQCVAMAAVPALVIRYGYGVRLADIGLTRRLERRHIALGVALGLVMLLLGATMEFGLETVVRFTLGAEALHSVRSASEMFSPVPFIKGAEGDLGAMAAILLAVAVGAPVAEELFFRGWLQRCARERFGVLASVLISAALFALAHGGPVLILAIFPMGLLLGWAYERTGSLWVVILMHAVNNGAATLGVWLFE
ncbi:MAG TPA: CPBP family intramembrane glutamic endopeptidase [Chthonomonadales bacterium]|nr:CPBP family intramembrane glutamic endopeptidase [Chthonomonadales bacterium]